MDPHLSEWINLTVRWVHLIVGIAWIGTSFFFNWLDSHLAAPVQTKKGVEGELWLVHSGGFYQIEKYQVAPDRLPSTLHWFKWEAYSTWLSGFALLVIIYYLGADIYLVDPEVANIPTWVAITLGIGVLIGSWLVYDQLCKSAVGDNPTRFALIALLATTAVAFGLSQVFSARAAFIHVGAMLGTLMVANVLAIIIPSQSQLVAATKKGVAPDAALGAKAKQRSIHNNYMTLPVLFIMISNHFPSTYSHRYNWLILVGLTLIGVGVRHSFNLKNKGHRHPWLLPAAAMGLIALAMVTASPSSFLSLKSNLVNDNRVGFTDVHTIINNRCVSCHSQNPTDDRFSAAPAGAKFDTAEQIRNQAAQINLRAVASQSMPLGNTTGMTPEEREILGKWIAEGAQIEPD
ncbi:MAG: urate hydroxylase PuuD [Gammaproteobacteria bacterium]|nr:urate hydroxylase PuuD [Gammaproteobacteria bacterium]